MCMIYETQQLLLPQTIFSWCFPSHFANKNLQKILLTTNSLIKKLFMLIMLLLEGLTRGDVRSQPGSEWDTKLRRFRPTAGHEWIDALT